MWLHLLVISYFRLDALIGLVGYAVFMRSIFVLCPEYWKCSTTLCIIDVLYTLQWIILALRALATTTNDADLNP
jgi:hypothetical protein